MADKNDIKGPGAKPIKRVAKVSTPRKPRAAKPAAAKPVAAAPAVAREPAAKPIPAAKTKAPVKAASKPVVAPVAKPVAAPAVAEDVFVSKPVEAPVAATVSPIASEPAPKAPTKIAKAVSKPFAGLPFNLFPEDKTMDMTANFTGVQDAITEAQAKAKEAFEKSTVVMGEVSDFAKGNVEAIIESGKILAEGVQGMGTEIVAEGRSAFETFSGDIKELAAAKSPTDFFKLQGDLMRKNFDSAVAYSSKSSESMLKLMSDAMAPISGRVSLAMEKARLASI